MLQLYQADTFELGLSALENAIWVMEDSEGLL